MINDEHIINDLLAYLDKGITSFHAVTESEYRLKTAGYTRLSEADSWQLTAGERYYVIRSGSGIIAWQMGQENHLGVRVIGAHTDSPGLHLKANPVYSKAGYLQFGVEVYGSPLLGTWTDRDLGLAGRISFKTKQGIEQKGLRIDRPILRIPQLAIHLNREVNKEGLKLDKQKHLAPMIALDSGDSEVDTNTLLKLLAAELEIDADSITGWDLELIDLQAAVQGGLNGDFIYSGRIDNLMMCHAALDALIEQGEDLPVTSVIALFDAEEIGSNTVNGAASPFIRDVLQRISQALDEGADALPRMIARSFCISADGAHAVHPNYSEYHDTQHQVMMNAGPVIKVNANQRYASTGGSASVFRALAKEVKVDIQNYVHRTDLPCGSTIGPITATNLGIRTVDVGNAMLSMHSIRETAGSHDQAKMIKVLSHFFGRERKELY